MEKVYHPHRRGIPRVILHGQRADDDEFRSAVERVREEGHAVEVRVTWEAGDGVTLAREAVAAGVPRIIAAGGDGTVHEVVEGVLEADESPEAGDLPSLGVVPLGTGNDFATAAGIPLEPVDALRIAFDRPARPVDVGYVEGKCFLNMATGGFGTEVTTSTPDELKHTLGGVAYLLTGLAHMSSVRSVEVRVSGPDFDWEGPLLVLAVGNGRLAGGGHRLCPDARIDDGALDVRIVPDIESGRLGAALGALLKGGIEELDTRIIGARLPWVEVESTGGLHVNLDGEPVSGDRFRFEIHPGRLLIHLPEGCPLVGG